MYREWIIFPGSYGSVFSTKFETFIFYTYNRALIFTQKIEVFNVFKIGVIWYRRRLYVKSIKKCDYCEVSVSYWYLTSSSLLYTRSFRGYSRTPFFSNGTKSLKTCLIEMHPLKWLLSTSAASSVYLTEFVIGAKENFHFEKEIFSSVSFDINFSFKRKASFFV